MKDDELGGEGAQPEKKVAKAVDVGKYADSLKEITGQDPADAAKWLGKILARMSDGGVTFPSGASVDPTRPDEIKRFVKSENDRRRLAARARQLLETLQSEGDTDEVDIIDAKIEKVSNLYKANQKKAEEAILPLEKSYRMLKGFFNNAEQRPGQKIDAFVFNADPEKLTTNDLLIQALSKEIRRKYRAFGMEKAYGLLVVPGWQGDIKKIERLASIGYDNKLVVITDAPDARTQEELVNTLEMDAYKGLVSSDKNRRNIVMVGNWVLARSANAGAGGEDLYLPPSAFLAGKVVNTDHEIGVQQPAAGYNQGKLQVAEAPRFDVDQDEASEVVKLGVNLLVNWKGMCRVWGDASLSAEEFYQSYPIARTEDWIAKNLLNFLLHQNFSLYNPSNKMAWQTAIRKFLNEISDKQGRAPILGGKADINATAEEIRKGIVNVSLMVEYQHAVKTFLLRVKEDKSGSKDAELESSAEAK